MSRAEAGQALDSLGWQRSGDHATLGRLDVAGVLQVAVEHDAEHLLGLRAMGRTRPG